MSNIDWTTLYCIVDAFCKEFEPHWFKTLLTTSVRHRNREAGLCLCEVMTTVIAFHYSKIRTFKHFYLQLLAFHRDLFPGMMSYSRFVSLKKMAMIPLIAFTRTHMSKCSGISIVDATPIVVCHNKRIFSHKIFDGLAKRGKSTMGYFFGFKLHLIINELGEILAFKLTPGNINDNKVVGELSKNLVGKLFGDKGYISMKLFKELFKRGLKLVTQARKNMKPRMMEIADRLILRKRSLIESVYHQLKDVMQIEHTRHRSSLNFMVNLFSGLAAYVLYPNKPQMRFDFNTSTQKLSAA